jgi:AraC family transcriptional regulator, transcriptional activator of pobA
MIEPFASYLKQHPNLHIAHRHSFYHIVLFTEGAGTHTIDFEQFPVHPGQIYFMIPGQVHSWAFSGKVDGFVINFSVDLFNTFLANRQFLEEFYFFRGIARESVIQLSPYALQITTDFLGRTLQETKSTTSFSKEIICIYLSVIFITINREHIQKDNKQTTSHNRLVLHNFKKLLELHYTQKRLPKEYAGLLYITANHLNGLCQDLTGKSAGTIIRDRILLEAKRLLINADMSISEIATQLNFTDNSYFTKFFKKYTQQTPEGFRKLSIKI